MKFTLFRETQVERVKKDIAADTVSGTPEQHSQLMYSGQNDTIKSGVWESTAGVFTASYTGMVEFCHILEGGADIKTDDGKVFSVKAGDAFVMDEGLQTEWTVNDYIKKHFVICFV